MKEKKKSHLGLILLASILLLICAGMGTFIFVNKDKLMLKENTTTSKDEKKETSTTTEKENNNDLFKSETIHSYYYETKQEGTIKYFMTLGNMSNDNNSGYFTIRYVSVYDSGSEAPLAAGYYDIEDGKLKLSVGPYTNTNKEKESEAVFKKLSANLEVDTEQYSIIAPNTPSYYKTYLTSYNENKLTIGNKTFYRVK